MAGPARSPRRCSDCSFEAKSAASLRNHENIVHKGIRYHCAHCPHYVYVTMHLRRHRALHHPDLPGQTFRCPECAGPEFWTDKAAELLKHWRREHEDGSGDDAEEIKMRSLAVHVRTERRED